MVLPVLTAPPTPSPPVTTSAPLFVAADTVSARISTLLKAALIVSTPEGENEIEPFELARMVWLARVAWPLPYASRVTVLAPAASVSLERTASPVFELVIDRPDAIAFVFAVVKYVPPVYTELTTAIPPLTTRAPAARVVSAAVVSRIRIGVPAFTTNGDVAVRLDTRSSEDSAVIKKSREPV